MLVARTRLTSIVCLERYEHPKPLRYGGGKELGQWIRHGDGQGYVPGEGKACVLHNLTAALRFKASFLERGISLCGVPGCRMSIFPWKTLGG